MCFFVGLKIGIVTNNFIVDLPAVKVPDFILSMNVICDEVIESCHTGLRKPDSEIYKLICKRLGVSPQEVRVKDFQEKGCVGCKVTVYQACLKDIITK